MNLNFKTPDFSDSVHRAQCESYLSQHIFGSCWKRFALLRYGIPQWFILGPDLLTIYLQALGSIIWYRVIFMQMSLHCMILLPHLMLQAFRYWMMC